MGATRGAVTFPLPVSVRVSDVALRGDISPFTCLPIGAGRAFALPACADKIKAESKVGEKSSSGVPLLPPPPSLRGGRLSPPLFALALGKRSTPKIIALPPYGTAAGRVSFDVPSPAFLAAEAAPRITSA